MHKWVVRLFCFNALIAEPILNFSTRVDESWNPRNGYSLLLVRTKLEYEQSHGQKLVIYILCTFFNQNTLL